MKNTFSIVSLFLCSLVSMHASYAQDVIKSSKQSSFMRKDTVNFQNIKSKEIDLAQSPEKSSPYVKSDDLQVLLSYNDTNSQYIISIIKHDKSLLTYNDLSPLEDGSLLKTYWTTSKLGFIQETSIELNDKNQFIVPVINKKPGCEAFYVSYHLKGDKFPITQAVLINKEKQSVPFMDKSCPMPSLDIKDTIGHTEDMYVAGFHWVTPAFSIKKPISFYSTISKDGDELYPKDLKAYAISTDFTHLYTFNSTKNFNGPSFGTKFTQHILYPDNYYFIINFKSNLGKNNSFIAKSIIQE